MATRSAIGFQLPDGKIKSVYCHWDGYPSHHMPILKEKYNTVEKVKKLIKKGAMSCLSTKDTWDEKDVRDEQPLYYIERGDDFTPPIILDFDSSMKHWYECWCEFMYIYVPRKGWDVFELTKED